MLVPLVHMDCLWEMLCSKSRHGKFAWLVSGILACFLNMCELCASGDMCDPCASLVFSPSSSSSLYLLNDVSMYGLCTMG